MTTSELPDAPSYEEAIQAEVDKLAQQLRRSVLVNDPMVQNFCRSGHFGDEDPLRIRALLQRDTGSAAVSYILSHGVHGWMGPGRIPPNPSLGMVHPRICTPIRQRGSPDAEIIGMIMMVDPDDSLTNGELELVQSTAVRLAPLVEGHLHPAANTRNREHLLWAALSHDSVHRHQALRSLKEWIGDRADFGAATAIRLAFYDRGRHPEGARAAQARAALYEVLSGDIFDTPATSARPPFGAERLSAGGANVNSSRRHPSGSRRRLSAVEQNTAVLVLGRPPSHVGRHRKTSGASEDIHALGAEHWEDISRELQQVREHFRRLAPEGFSLLAGVGSQTADLENVHDSAWQAGLALTAARRGLTGDTVMWKDLGPWSLLLLLPEEHLTRNALPDEVQRLLRAVPYDELLRTLKVYLNRGGNGPAAAEELHIHRTTLYYRLGRISDLAGLDLSDGRTRLSLHIGLTMLDILD